MKTAALAILLLMVAAGSAPGGEPGDVVDVSGLIRPVSGERAPRLGIEHLQSGGAGFGRSDEYPDDPPGPIHIDDFAKLVDCGVGRNGAALGLGPNMLLLDPRLAPFAREALRSFLADVSRRVRIEVIATRPNGTELRGEILARPGRWGRLVRVQSHSIVFDFDVELACDNSGGYFPCVVGDPIVGAALTGFAVEVRPFLVDGGRAIALEAVIQAERMVGVDTVLTGARYLGAIELPTSRSAMAVVSGTVPSGKPLVTRISTAEGETVITLTPTVEGDSGAGKLRLLDAGLAMVGPVEVRIDPRDIDPGIHHSWALEAATKRLAYGDPARQFADLDITPIAEGHTGFLSTLGGGDIATAGSLDFQQSVRKKLERVLAPLSRTARLQVTLRAGDVVMGQGVLSALHGRTAFLRLGTDRNMIRDHDVEVGCYVQIADPIVTPFFDGFLIRARPRFAPDGKTILLSVNARIQGLGAKPVRRELHEKVCSSLQLITMPSREIRSEMVLGADETVELAAGLDGEGRPLVLEITSVLRVEIPGPD